MKILHTSDWHLGQELYSHDRTEEHISFLTQLKDIVKKEQPDVMVVSGDIYQSATPSNSVMTLFTNKVLEIAMSCPTMKIVITAGNHDSSSRLEINRSLWQHLNVEVVGRVEKTENGMVDLERHIVEVKSSDGKVIGYVVAMPHVFPQSYPLINEETPREQRQIAFYKALNDRLGEINNCKLPVVMMAHMAVTGSDTTGHDMNCGGMDFIDVSNVMVDYDYLALGHIHCPQNVVNSRVRYCGSPIAVSFDEDYEHSVSLVKIESGKEPEVSKIKIENPIPLVTMPKTAADFEDVLSLIADLPSDRKMYVRLNVKLKDVPPINAREQAAMLMKDKQARFCTIKWERENPSGEEAVSINYEVDEMQTVSPLEIAKQYYQSTYKQPLSQHYIDMIDFVINEVGNPNTQS